MRTPFLAIEQMGATPFVLQHPGLGEQPLPAYRGDVLALEQLGFIRVTRRHGQHSFEFDVTADGARQVDSPLTSEPQRRWGQWIAIDGKPFKRSAMSALWRVRHESDSERTPRALKEMRYEKGRSSAAYRRFVREIEILASRIKHDGVIQILDHSIPAEKDESRPYYVMPLAQGSLESAKFLKGKLEPVLELGLVIAGALGAGHAVGVVHRDVKPSNVLLFDEEFRPVVADFGISFLEEEDRLTRTEAGTVGTADFVAPELLGGGRSEAVTSSTDVYSLAKTLYAVVSGGDVFPRERFQEERFDLERRFGDARLAHLRGLLEVMVTEDPGDRLQTMEEVSVLLRRALENIRAGEPYRDGLYSSAPGARERIRKVTATLEQPASVKRADALRTAIADAFASGRERASQHRSTRLVREEQIDAEAAAVAVQVADDLLSIGLPLIVADEREEFEEWLSEVVDFGRKHHGPDSGWQVRDAAAALVVHAAGAFAWHRRRLEIMRIVVDRFVARGGVWIHLSVLADKASRLVEWVKNALTESQTIPRVDASFIDTLDTSVSFFNGMAALKILEQADPERMKRFLADPSGIDFPVTFAPGLIDVEWVPELVRIGLRSGKDERDLALKLFDRTAEQFRQLCGSLSHALLATHEQARYRSKNADTQLPFIVDVREWETWTGTPLSSR